VFRKFITPVKPFRDLETTFIKINQNFLCKKKCQEVMSVQWLYKTRIMGGECRQETAAPYPIIFDASG